jgi:hypothetical protein
MEQRCDLRASRMNKADKIYAWYHGGISGLQPGDYLLPAKETGIWANANADNERHEGRVYITPSIETAQGYAYGLPEDLGLGCVYRVDPEGTIEQDEIGNPTLFTVMLGDSPETQQFYCARAKVLYPVHFASSEERERRMTESKDVDAKAIVLGILGCLFLPPRFHKPL